MNITKLYRDFNIPYASSGQRHYRTGWVNTACPFCAGSGKPGNHLGYCMDSKSQFYGRFVCWRCGSKPFYFALAALLKTTEQQAREIATRYGGEPNPEAIKPRPLLLQEKPLRNIHLPPGTKKLLDVVGACRYLERRGFDPEQLAKQWGVKATGPNAILTRDGNHRLDLSYRLVVPVYYRGVVVSWQCRDWTGKAALKYLTCPPELESRHHKALLYGMDEALGKGCATLVEGVTDVWALGPGAVACFGIKYRPEQVRKLKQWPTVRMMLDMEPAAQLQASQITTELEEAGVETTHMWLPKGKDPADMIKEGGIKWDGGYRR